MERLWRGGRLKSLPFFFWIFFFFWIRKGSTLEVIKSHRLLFRSCISFFFLVLVVRLFDIPPPSIRHTLSSRRGVFITVFDQ
ncbi:hypothetical protein F4811DRAFT_161928 [Daldinia bambusicola]|nr:hypothetical protein F4811DRAFT_161928 [Daldinia bambusicola]